MNYTICKHFLTNTQVARILIYLAKTGELKGFMRIGELEDVYVLTNVHRNEFAFISAKSIVDRTKRRIYI